MFIVDVYVTKVFIVFSFARMLQLGIVRIRQSSEQLQSRSATSTGSTTGAWFASQSVLTLAPWHRKCDVTRSCVAYGPYPLALTCFQDEINQVMNFVGFITIVSYFTSSWQMALFRITGIQYIRAFVSLYLSTVSHFLR